MIKIEIVCSLPPYGYQVSLTELVLLPKNTADDLAKTNLFCKFSKLLRSGQGDQNAILRLPEEVLKKEICVTSSMNFVDSSRGFSKSAEASAVHKE